MPSSRHLYPTASSQPSHHHPSAGSLSPSPILCLLGRFLRLPPQLLFLPDPSPHLTASFAHLSSFCTQLLISLVCDTSLVLWCQGFQDLVSFAVLIHLPHLSKLLLSEFPLPTSIWKILLSHHVILPGHSRWKFSFLLWLLSPCSSRTSSPSSRPGLQATVII